MKVFLLVFFSALQVTKSLVDYSCVHASAWKLNTNNHYNSHFSSFTDVTSSSYASGSWSASFYGIPNYDRVFTQEDIDALNSRPKASTDFYNGHTTATAGSSYVWGDNLGYKSVGPSCSLGYWPPGPSCPSKKATTASFTLKPAPDISSSGCTTSLGTIGYLVNGVSIYDTGDAQTYLNQGVWHNTAYNMEYYDIDPCLGHASQDGKYHHHNFSPCLQEKLGDHGTGHSPVYGFGLDGYPIYGPYQAAHTLAVSCWQKRDYKSSSPTGCSDGKRSCLLNDQWDYTKGTKMASSAGPNQGSYVSTLSGNSILAVSGVYEEDFFYNSSCFTLAGAHLNSFNGHDHDGLGFHYHITIDSDGVAQYPYQMGPKYYGCVPGSSCGTCGTTTGTTTAACTMATSPTSPPTAAPTEADLVIEMGLTLNGLTSSTLSDLSKQAVRYTVAHSMGINMSHVALGTIQQLAQLSRMRVSRRFLTTVSANIDVMVTLSPSEFGKTSAKLYEDVTSAWASATSSNLFTTTLRSYSTAIGAAETVAAGYASSVFLNSPTMSPTLASKSKPEFMNTAGFYVMIAVLGTAVLAGVVVTIFCIRRSSGGTSPGQQPQQELRVMTTR